VQANLYKLAEVLQVEDITSVPSLHRELVIIKVVASQEVRSELMRVVETFQGRVIEVSPDSLVIEATGSEEVIDSMVEGVRPYGILEMTRTGRVAMTRRSSPMFTLPARHAALSTFTKSPDTAGRAAQLRNCS
jgi:acetolactate synthase-1/3 small subunit